MAAELFPSKKLLPSASEQEEQEQEQQQREHEPECQRTHDQPSLSSNNNSSRQAGCTWQGLYPTIRERWVPRQSLGYAGGAGGGKSISLTPVTITELKQLLLLLLFLNAGTPSCSTMT